MKNPGLFLLMVLFITSGFAQSPVFDWVKATQGTNKSVARSVITDSLGNLVITGAFAGTVDFDPGPSVFNLSSNRVFDFDCYVLKLDSNGNFIWAKSFGGIGNDAPSWCDIDRNGNIYVVGEFQDTVDFDPGIGVKKLYSRNLSSDDGFLVKLDANGNFQWANSMGGTPGDYYTSIEVDISENVYLTGFFYGIADFDPGSGVYNMTSNGWRDVFVQKLDKSGNFIWAKSFGSRAADMGFSIVSDDSGFVYLTGIYSDTADFDPGLGTTILIPKGDPNSFVQKLDSNGNFIWAKSFGGATTNSLKLVLDAKRNILITGYYYTGGDFDPGLGVFNLQRIGVVNMFILKLNNNGRFLWAKSMQGVGQSIQTDQQGNVYTTGDFTDTSDFDPGPNTYNLISNGIRDVFIQKLDSNGDFIWVLSMGGTKYEGSSSIYLDQKLNIYTTGMFYSSSVDFDPSVRVYNLSCNSQYESFIHKISQCKTLRTDSISACDSITWIDGITYVSDNSSAIYTTVNSSGCDSVIELRLDIKKSSTTIDTKSSCSDFTWINGITYALSNDTAKYLLTNNQGCDSVVRLNYVRKYPSTAKDVHSACNSYTWIDGVTYTNNDSSSKYTLINSQGCDSIVNLNLELNKVNKEVFLQNDSIIISKATKASYQWLKCDQDFEPIPQESKDVLIAKTNGNYAVEVRQNGCTDTSNCVSISSFVIPTYRSFTCSSIFPNPSHGVFNLELGNMKYTNVRLYNTNGNVIGFEDNISGPFYKLNLELPVATYILQVETENGTHRCRIEVN